MRCPFCTDDDSQVKDSRSSEDGAAIRRRRLCNGCGARFTTYERIQLKELTVVKSDGKAETFRRAKLLKSMKVALRKRPVEEEKIERAVNSIVRQLESGGDSEITSNEIGKCVMISLYTLDKVGYVRYASVYQDFRDTTDFNEFVGDLHDRINSEVNDEKSKKVKK